MKKTVAILSLVTLLIFTALVVLFIWGLVGSDASQSNNGVQKPDQNQKNADPVKSSNGPNNDTKPSSNGTGPGSNNSLLGPTQ